MLPRPCSVDKLCAHSSSDSGTAALKLPAATMPLASRVSASCCSRTGSVRCRYPNWEGE
jgi:hypothetical protein